MSFTLGRLVTWRNDDQANLLSNRLTNLNIHFIRQFTILMHERINYICSKFYGHISSKSWLIYHVTFFGEVQVAKQDSDAAFEVNAQDQG